MEGNKFSAGFINVVASPHPEGIYVKALKRLANDPINFYGNSYAAIREPRQTKDDPQIWEGVVTIWTEVDTTEPSILKETLGRVDKRFQP